MSLRTMPLSASTLGPFEPSPGKGPAVSSAMTVHVPVDPLPTVDTSDAASLVGGLVERDAPAITFAAPPASASTAPPPNIWSRRRRCRNWAGRWRGLRRGRAGRVASHHDRAKLREHGESRP